MVDGVGEYVLVVCITIIVVLILLGITLLGFLGKLYEWLHVKRRTFCARNSNEFIMTREENNVLWGHYDEYIWPGIRRRRGDSSSSSSSSTETGSAQGGVTQVFEPDAVSCYLPPLITAMYRLGELSQYLRCSRQGNLRDMSRWSPGLKCVSHLFNRRSLTIGASFLCFCGFHGLARALCGCCCRPKARHYTASVLECRDTKTQCITFATTGTLGHWQKDIRFKQKHPTELACFPENPNMKMHSGIYEIYREIRPKISRLVETIHPQRLFLCGHSLGGALAVVAACDLHSQFPSLPIVIVTFGQPRIGNPDFARHVANTHIPYFRIFNTEDTIPFLPPTRVACSCFCLDEHYAHTKSRIPCMFSINEMTMTGNHCKAYDRFVRERGGRLHPLYPCPGWEEETNDNNSDHGGDSASDDNSYVTASSYASYEEDKTDK